MRPPWWVGPEAAVGRARDRDEGDAPMTGRCRGRARNIWARPGRVALAVLLTGSTLLSAVGTAILPFSARAQSEGEWVDPLADSQMTDISANVDQTIADVWNGDADDGWVEAAPSMPRRSTPPRRTTPTATSSIQSPALRWRSDPTGRRSTPPRVSTSTRSGNLIDPATGMAVSYDANGQPVVAGAGGRAGRDDRRER